MKPPIVRLQPRGLGVGGGGVGYSRQFYMRRFRSDLQPLTLLYTILTL